MSFSLEELPSKLRGVVKSTKKLEAEIAAVKISYLKKVNEGSNIIILDSWVPSVALIAHVQLFHFNETELRLYELFTLFSNPLTYM